MVTAIWKDVTSVDMSTWEILDVPVDYVIIWQDVNVMMQDVMEI